MKKICQELSDQGFDLGSKTALEFFAREGDWQTLAYADKVKSLEAWEIDSQFEPGLRKNLPKATIRIGDSYKLAANPENFSKFDFVVVDNPQGIFGPGYCEHFEALPLALNLLKDKGALIYNINWAPFDYDSKEDWKKRRNGFYKLLDTSKLDEIFLKRFYHDFFVNQGYVVEQLMWAPRNNEYLSYMVAILRRQRI